MDKTRENAGHHHGHNKKSGICTKEFINWLKNKSHHSIDVKFHCHLTFIIHGTVFSILKPLSYDAITLIGRSWLRNTNTQKWLFYRKWTKLFYGCSKFYIDKKVLINLKSHETNHKVAITHLNICCSFLGSWELSPLWTHLIQNGWL